MLSAPRVIRTPDLLMTYQTRPQKPRSACISWRVSAKCPPLFLSVAVPCFIPARDAEPRGGSTSSVVTLLTDRLLRRLEDATTQVSDEGPGPREADRPWRVALRARPPRADNFIRKLLRGLVRRCPPALRLCGT